MWWWRLIVFAESARRRRHLFLLSLEKPYSDYFQIFAACILALGNLSGIFCLRLSVFSTKSKMAAKILWRTLELEYASSICFMFGLKERPYSGRELKSFWCDSDNKNFDIFTF